MDDLVRPMGMEGISKNQVSRLCAETDERVQDFLGRPIEGSAYTPTALSLACWDLREGQGGGPDCLRRGHHRGGRQWRWPA